jgi:murein DD-endopeptidase MepM/ murein hydrolase activator NlpD
MNCPKRFAACLAIILIAVLNHDTGFAKKNKERDRVKTDFIKADLNRDNRLSPKEWNRRGNFDKLDSNRDGSLSLQEVRQMYKGHDRRNYTWPPENHSPAEVVIDPTVRQDRVDKSELDAQTKCGIARLMRCDFNAQILKGLAATGTGPVFPAQFTCPGIDDYWAMDYESKRNRPTFHGGIDIPVPWGTPVRAVADGSVVALYDETLSKRGNEVVLRHRPDQTGLPMWTYTAYGHLDGLPDLQIGQQLKMGEIIGPTGNSGISAKGTKGSAQSTTRRPAIHLAMFYSPHPQYTEANNTVVPKEGRWLDPMAFYRQKPPFDTPSVQALPETEKSVMIPVMLRVGTTIPEKTKIIWPYTCQ